MTTVTLSVTTTSRPVLGNGGGGGGAIPPSNTVAPVLSGTPTVGQTLSCSTGTWLGTLPITYTYQWKRGVSNISGATSSTYTLVQADALQTITCDVTATNVVGSASATSNSIIAQDADAYAFLTAASITNTTQVDAINNLVINLKAAGIWTKMKAIYPFVGGTATTHKWNLKNPLDSDAAFRLVFFGGMTHSSNGILFGGVNGYADTKLNMSSNYSVNDSTHISFYSRTSAAGFQDFEMGVFNGTSIIGVTLRRSDFSFSTYYAVNSGAYISFTDSNAAAFYISNRLGTTENGWRNSTKTATTTNTALARPSLNMWIGGQNFNNSLNQPTIRECAFASIGDGLTDTEAANFYTAVQNFNTSLSRQV